MLIFNGKNLEDFGVTVIGRGTYGAPARDVEVVHVPGRNGDVIFDNGGFMNQTITYPGCCIEERFPENFAGLRNFLMATSDYCELRDSYHPGEFRLARYNGPLDPDVHTARGNQSGIFDLSFDCMPQRFLDSGNEYIEVPYFRHTTNGPYEARLFFEKAYRPHTIKIESAYEITVTFTRSGTTETQTGTELTFEVPSSSATYVDISSTGTIKRITYDGREYSFAGDQYNLYTVIENPTDQTARPIWSFNYAGVPYSSVFNSVIYNDRAESLRADTGMTVKRLGGQKQINVDLDAMVYYAVTTVDIIETATVSGTIPIFLPGKNYVHITTDNVLTRVRVKPGWWEV